MTATDSLSVWLRVRREADWQHAPVLQRIPPASDGFRTWCEGPVRRRDPVRAQRLLAAHTLARADAARRTPLNFALLADWQREVLGETEVPFRVNDAYAKDGRERYGLTPRTQTDFASCLRESTDSDIPLAARAARAYLDVAFFHPFHRWQRPRCPPDPGPHPGPGGHRPSGGRPTPDHPIRG